MSLVKYDHNANSAKEVLAAVTGQHVLCRMISLAAAGDVAITVEDTDGDDLYGPVTIDIDSGANPLTVHFDPPLVTPDDTGLEVYLGGAVVVDGVVDAEYEANSNPATGENLQAGSYAKHVTNPHRAGAIQTPAV